MFAITQVTQMMADDPTWAGLARGGLVLSAIWWAWVGYSWLTNTIDPQEGIARLAVFLAMAAMLVLAPPRARRERHPADRRADHRSGARDRRGRLPVVGVLRRGGAGRRAQAHQRQGVARNAMARDSYSFLHLPMIAGIVLLALGVKRTLAHVDDPLKIEMAAALMGGVALYLLAHVAFRLRNTATISRQRIVAAVALLAIVPLAPEVDALVALATTTLVLVALIAHEAIRFAEARDRVRHLGLSSPPR